MESKQEITILFKQKNDKRLTLEIPTEALIKDTITLLDEHFNVGTDLGVTLYKDEARKYLLNDAKTFPDEGINPKDTVYGYVQAPPFAIKISKIGDVKEYLLEVDPKSNLGSLRSFIDAQYHPTRPIVFLRRELASETNPQLEADKTFEELNIGATQKIYFKEDYEGGC